MYFDEPLIIERDIESTIDRQPLLVTPDTPLFEVVVLMSQRIISQNPSIMADNPNLNDGKRKISSFVLVVENEKLLGIFTERDIVKLAAEGRDMQTLTIREVMTPDVITLPINSLRDVFGPLFLFRRYKIRHLPIVGDRGELIGIISQDSIRQLVRPTDFLKLKRVSEVMTTSVVNAPLTTSVSEIAQLMTAHGVSCVVITQEMKVENDEENLVCPVGIVTERDIVQFQALQLNLVQTPVETVMSTPLFLLQPEDSLWTAYKEMQSRKVRRLVVSWDWGKGIGIVTQTNLLQSLELKEIFEVEETVEKTVQASESQKIQQILNQKIDQQEQLESSLLRLYENLGNIFSKTNISPHIPQSQVQSVLFDIGEMRDFVRKMNQETKDLQKLARINFDEDGSIYPSQTVIEHEQNIDDEIGENLPKSLPKIATGG
jgi:CBS domain-containing protein